MARGGELPDEVWGRMPESPDDRVAVSLRHTTCYLEAGVAVEHGKTLISGTACVIPAWALAAYYLDTFRPLASALVWAAKASAEQRAALLHLMLIPDVKAARAWLDGEIERAA